MKATKWIITAGILAILGSWDAQAQDDAYMTPSRAREWRRQEEARIAKVKAERAERERKWQEENKKYQQERKAVSDWYNRRDMKVTIEEMESNLDNLEDGGRPRSGKYSQRLRRFGTKSDALVLENVARVYVLDDMDYDPWTGNYYGRDRSSGVNITINTSPGYGGWCDGYWGFGYPYYGYRGCYYDPWYRPWRGSWYSGWYYGSSWGGSFAYHRPWLHEYYGPSYWDGYYDGVYSSRYYTPRRYNTYGRSSGAYYDRTARSAEYGRALGQGGTAYSRSNNGYYDRMTNTRTIGNTNRSGSHNNRTTTTRRSNVDNGWSNRSMETYSPSRSSGNQGGGSYGTPSLPSNPSRSTGGGGTSRVRR